MVSSLSRPRFEHDTSLAEVRKCLYHVSGDAGSPVKSPNDLWDRPLQEWKISPQIKCDRADRMQDMRIRHLWHLHFPMF